MQVAFPQHDLLEFSSTERRINTTNTFGPFLSKADIAGALVPQLDLSTTQ